MFDNISAFFILFKDAAMWKEMKILTRFVVVLIQIYNYFFSISVNKAVIAH